METETNYVDIGELLNSCGSDKNSFHKYGNGYNLIFSEQFLKQRRPLKVLEIGVFNGASINGFSQIPYVSEVVGVDTYSSFVTDNPKITLYIGNEFDAYSLRTLEMLKNNHEKFDIIIDDGPHTWESQEWFFRNYGELLNEGGVLVCEDIHIDYATNLKKLQIELDLYVLDLRFNANPDYNEFLALRYKRGVI